MNPGDGYPASAVAPYRLKSGLRQLKSGIGAGTGWGPGGSVGGLGSGSGSGDGIGSSGRGIGGKVAMRTPPMVNLVFYPVSFRLQRLGLQSGGHDAKPHHQAPWGEAVGPPPLTPADIGVAGPCADRIGRTASL